MVPPYFDEKRYSYHILASNASWVSDYQEADPTTGNLWLERGPLGKSHHHVLRSMQTCMPSRLCLIPKCSFLDPTPNFGLSTVHFAMFHQFERKLLCQKHQHQP